MSLASNTDGSAKSDDRFRILVEAIVDYAIYLLDTDGTVTSWNAGAERFKGYKAAEIIGQHFSRFYTEEDRASGLPQHALNVAETTGKFEAEGWRVKKDGSRFWAHVVIDPVRREDGQLLGFAKITRDLTERRQAEVALRSSEERFRLLVQGVSDYALYMLDPNGRVSSWNSGAQKIKGYQADEIIGEHFSRFYAAEDRAAGLPQLALETAIRDGRFEKEGWRLRKDGSRFWANVVIDPVRDDQGTLLGFAKITRDLTERRKAQEALDAARENFFHSQRLESLGRLTGGIAHDFNNLLAAVLGSLELVRKRVDPDPRIIRLLDNALAGAQRGVGLTQRMLAFARRQELKPVPVDLIALVRGVSDLLQLTAGATVSIDLRFPPSLNPIKADANQLEMALLNLVGNARDALPEGGSVTIEASERMVVASPAEKLAAGRYICLCVTDRGIGMDAATLARATDPFFTTKAVGKGTGLGLSVVHGVAEQLGGGLVLRSRKGEGTTAELWLPVAEEAVIHGAGDGPEDALHQRSIRILVVDDDAIVLLNTAAMLEDLGHEVLPAGSGHEALEILRREPIIDLVVTDEMMPRMRGTELAQLVEDERPGLPILVVSGYAELGPETTGKLPRLAKPFRQTELAEAIASLVTPRSPATVFQFRSGNGR